MVLLDRIAQDLAIDSSLWFQGHGFENAMKLYLHDKVDRATVLTRGNIPPEQEADFDQFKTYFLALAPTDRQAWVQVMEACTVLLQQDSISRDEYNSFTGLTLSTEGRGAKRRTA
jgi:hypothetical protein